MEIDSGWKQLTIFAKSCHICFHRVLNTPLHSTTNCSYCSFRIADVKDDLSDFNRNLANPTKNLGNYTWDVPSVKTDNDKSNNTLTLEGWPPDRSRDPTNYIDLKSFIVMDFNKCERGNTFFKTNYHVQNHFT